MKTLRTKTINYFNTYYNIYTNKYINIYNSLLNENTGSLKRLIDIHQVIQNNNSIINDEAFILKKSNIIKREYKLSDIIAKKFINYYYNSVDLNKHKIVDIFKKYRLKENKHYKLLSITLNFFKKTSYPVYIDADGVKHLIKYESNIITETTNINKENSFIKIEPQITAKVIKDNNLEGLFNLIQKEYICNSYQRKCFVFVDIINKTPWFLFVNDADYTLLDNEFVIDVLYKYKVDFIKPSSNYCHFNIKQNKNTTTDEVFNILLFSDFLLIW